MSITASTVIWLYISMTFYGCLVLFGPGGAFHLSDSLDDFSDLLITTNLVGLFHLSWLYTYTYLIHAHQVNLRWWCCQCTQRLHGWSNGFLALTACHSSVNARLFSTNSSPECLTTMPMMLMSRISLPLLFNLSHPNCNNSSGTRQLPSVQDIVTIMLFLPTHQPTSRTAWFCSILMATLHPCHLLPQFSISWQMQMVVSNMRCNINNLWITLQTQFDSFFFFFFF